MIDLLTLIRKLDLTMQTKTPEQSGLFIEIINEVKWLTVRSESIDRFIIEISSSEIFQEPTPEQLNEIADYEKTFGNCPF